MTGFRASRFLVWSALCAGFLGSALWPKAALALPTFAQAYQVDCSVCHSFVPGLNAYGRYVQSTAFGALDPKLLHKVLPFVVRETVNYKSVGDLDTVNAQTKQLKYTGLGLSVNAVGAINKYISYRLEQSLYSNNRGGGTTGHFWVSYNQLFNGDGHLILGKFDAPAPPAYSFWMDSGLKEGSITVGQHSYNIGGQRWGIGFNYVPINYEKQPYKVQVAYVGNSPSMYNNTAFDSLAGSDRAFQYKVAFARPDNPVEVGLYGAVGTYMLSNYVNPIDNYAVQGLYLQRDPIGYFPGLLLNYQRTQDSNIGPGAGLVQSATSWAYAFELDESFLNGDVVLGLRPVEFLGGYNSAPSETGGLYNYGYTRPHYGNFDILLRDPKLSPYFYLTVEQDYAATAYVAAPYNPNGLPLWSISLKWAGPIQRL
jgi:hypothetical protein